MKLANVSQTSITSVYLCNASLLYLGPVLTETWDLRVPGELRLINVGRQRREGAAGLPWYVNYMHMTWSWPRL